MPKYEGMEKKTLKLEEKMSEIEARLAELIKLKAEYEKKLTDSQNTQIVYLARQSNLTLDEMKEIFRRVRTVKGCEYEHCRYCRACRRGHGEEYHGVRRKGCAEAGNRI